MSQLPLSEQLLGFDARENWISYAEAWPETRRERYLLRTDLEKPLSVDGSVWSSLLAATKEGGAYPPNPLGLRNTVNEVHHPLAESQQGVAGPYMFVAISLAGLRLDPQDSMQWALLLPLLPAGGPASDWALLGYDVADLALTSGLMNSGYSSEDRVTLRAQWAPRLNAFHLFTDREQAAEYKLITDRRVPEHAPFFVYGLYRVQRPEPERAPRDHPL